MKCNPEDVLNSWLQICNLLEENRCWMGVAQKLKTVDIAGFKCWNKDHIEGSMRYSYRLVGGW